MKLFRVMRINLATSYEVMSGRQIFGLLLKKTWHPEISEMARSGHTDHLSK